MLIILHIKLIICLGVSYKFLKDAEIMNLKYYENLLRLKNLIFIIILNSTISIIKLYIANTNEFYL
jgi:hypothetical protein